MAALYEMAQTFSASLDLRDVISITVNHLERLLPFNTCVVYIRQSGDDSIVAAHVFGDSAEQIRGRSVKAGYGIAGWVVINGRPMANTDPALDLGESITAEAGFKTAAVFPLMGQSEPIGALALYTRNVDTYSPEQLQLLESVTRLTSSALQRALLYEETRESAYTDALTGLPNGRSLYARFEHEIATAREDETTLTVLSLSLFGLREVNDTFGYRVGDRMLIEVARVLRAVVAGRGFLSRVAGDQFICLLRGCGAREAAVLGQDSKSRVGELELPVRGHHVARVGLCHGAAQYPRDGETVDELLQAASLEASKNKIDHEIPPFELPREAAIPASL
jgi:diguanylate cyclase (GGDEF)-like protein